jgi:hypothetical protein
MLPGGCRAAQEPDMQLVQSVNVALRFLVEVRALVALGYWGF